MKGFGKKIGATALLFALSTATNAAASSAVGFNESAQTGFRYGPNLSYGFVGNTPFVWGQWLPQAMGTLRYTWLEPLDMLPYGERLGRDPSYLRMDASLELAPFYGGYSAGLGLRPFRTNPSFEITFNYESYLYFMSNLEMVTADVAGGGLIAQTWNADYIVDNVWGDDAKFDYSQLFDFGANVEYVFKGGSAAGLSLHYILSDVSTDFDGKSYDYRRNIPVFSRDFLIEVDLYGRLPLNQYFAMLYESSFYRTGYLRSENTVQKEALGYGKSMMGVHFSWNDGLQNVTLSVGGWKRLDEDFYDGSLAQQFLIQFEYQGYFTFPLHRNFAE
ncbi:MAG: hypothetical protein MJY98_10155 [Fibrobacter sp.]|nr:hypothetical protein [Fibrobacter sp.]